MCNSWIHYYFFWMRKKTKCFNFTHAKMIGQDKEMRIDQLTASSLQVFVVEQTCHKMSTLCATFISKKFLLRKLKRSSTYETSRKVITMNKNIEIISNCGKLNFKFRIIFFLHEQLKHFVKPKTFSLSEVMKSSNNSL